MHNIHIKNKFVDTVVNLGRAMVVKTYFSGIELIYESGNHRVYNDIEDAYKLPDILVAAGLVKIADNTYANLERIREVKLWGSAPANPEDLVALELITDALDGEMLSVPYSTYLKLVENSVTLL